MHALDFGLAVNAASGVLMVALGAFVARVPAGSRANRGFALFAIPFGCAWVVENLWGLSGLHSNATAIVVVGASLALSAVGLVIISASYLGTLEDTGRRHAIGAAAVAIGVFAANAAFLLTLHGRGLLASFSDIAVWFGFWTFHATAWGTLVFYALRYPHVAETNARRAGGMRLMSVALALYPAFRLARETTAAIQLTQAGPLASAIGLALILAPVTGVAALWLRNAARSGRPAAESAVAWIVVATAAVGVPHLGFEDNHPGFGIARTVGVVIFAYAIVRHQLLGIDVKVRFAISKSTVAAVFVGVFFIASEAAQQFFGELFHKEYWGIAAAGLLVFAIAPLHRMTDRLAEKAVPVASGSSTLASPMASGNEELYRNAVRLAFRDRTLTRPEELHLFRLAGGLGLSPARAHEILVDVETEKKDLAA